MGAEISQHSLNIFVYSAHFPCQNAHTSIYEVRRKSLCFRGLPPNSLSFKVRIFYSTAACAAASRAIGTRNGEQEA